MQEKTAKNLFPNGSEWWCPAPNWDRSEEMSGNPAGPPSECSRAMQLHDQSRSLVLPSYCQQHQGIVAQGTDPLSGLGGCRMIISSCKTKLFGEHRTADASFPMSF